MRIPVKVVVLGGGPAGSSAALALARHGVRVTLLEARRFPRSRPGESLPPAVEPLLKQLGLGGDLAAAGFFRTGGVSVRWADGEETRREPGQDWRGVWMNYQADRAHFDTLLMEGARRAGVEIRELVRADGVLVEDGRVTGVRIGSEKLSGTWLLDASGGHHWLARKLGLQKSFRSRNLHARYGYAQDTAFGPEAEPSLHSDLEGWTWIAPLGGRRTAWVRLRWDGRPEPAGWRPARLAGTTPLGASRGADVTWRCVSRPAGPGYFCLGDAACVLDPLSSHGVLRAIMSGMQAAHLVRNVLFRGMAESRAIATYNEWLKGWFEHDAKILESFYRQAGVGLDVPVGLG